MDGMIDSCHSLADPLRGAATLAMNDIRNVIANAALDT